MSDKKRHEKEQTKKVCNTDVIHIENNSVLCNMYATKLFNKFEVKFNQLIEDLTMVYSNSTFIFKCLLKCKFSKVLNFFI